MQLPGYPGGYDIVGNWVHTQFQLDAFGEALLLFAAAARYDRLDTNHWRAAGIAAEAIAKRWTEPDAGIWELDNRPWTQSRLTAAAGLRAIAAATHGEGGAADWLTLADRIVADTAARAVHPDGHWQRAPDDPHLDASLLLAGLRGATAPDDPRAVKTFEAYLRELTVGRLRLPLPARRPSARPTPKARSCSAASSSRSPTISTETRWPPEAGMTRLAPRSGHHNCSARNTTPRSIRCAATCRKPSSTPSTSKRPTVSPKNLCRDRSSDDPTHPRPARSPS